MKYYAVTDDPRELYHHGVKGMKWGQHIFGPEPGLKKSDAYRKAQQKLKSLSAKTSSAAKTSGAKVSKSVKSLGSAIKKSAAQASYNARAAQQNRFNKSVERSEKKIAKIDAKIDRYFENKPVKDAKRQLAISTAKHNMANAFKSIGSAVKKTPGQISYNIRRKQQEQYNKAVQNAENRNRLSETLRSLDKEEKIRARVNRDEKIAKLQEKQQDIMANNDLKNLRKAVKVEKNMPKYYQEARTGTLAYGKLSDEQIQRLQNRLALEANTRRLGSTEAPSWRQQKKMARRQGYLQGITKGISAGMEEVAKAGVQYGIKNLANRKKMNKASELKAEREKQANRIKNKKTHSEMRDDLKQEAYKAQVEAGVHAIQRGALTTRAAARQLQYAKRIQNENQGKLDDAREERKFLMDERHNTARAERQHKDRLAEFDREVESIGKSLTEHGYAIVPTYNKDGKKTGTKILTPNGDIGKKDSKGNPIIIPENDGSIYLKLYESKHKNDKKTKTSAERIQEAITEQAIKDAKTKAWQEQRVKEIQEANAAERRKKQEDKDNIKFDEKHYIIDSTANAIDDAIEAIKNRGIKSSVGSVSSYSDAELRRIARSIERKKKKQAAEQRKSRKSMEGNFYYYND